MCSRNGKEGKSSSLPPHSPLCLPPCAHLPLGLTLLLFAYLPVSPPAGHGQCNCGRCDCKEGWAGKKCEHPLSCALSLESSTRKCRGTSNLPCFGRGSRSFRSTCLLPWLPQQASTLSSPLSMHERQFPAFLTSQIHPEDQIKCVWGKVWTNKQPRSVAHLHKGSCYVIAGWVKGGSCAAVSSYLTKVLAHFLWTTWANFIKGPRSHCRCFHNSENSAQRSLKRLPPGQQASDFLYLEVQCGTFYGICRHKVPLKGYVHVISCVILHHSW